MRGFKNAMEIFKLLPGTNCRKCLVPTCLAFAVAAFKGDRRLRDCPYLDGSVLEQYEGQSPNWMIMEQEYQRALEPLKREVATIDFPLSTGRLGASLSGDKLVIRSLGKDFQVSPDGSIVSACHVHAWITVPLMNYIVSCSGKTPSGKWVPFRELKDGISWGPLFADQFEIPLKQIADAHTDLFETMIQIFSGRPEPSPIGADISIALQPLPRLPILICYWKPENGLESSLKVLVDTTAEDNLNIESIFILCVGLVRMFAKVSDTHG
jgi:uncharacterized protein DUF3786/putative Fe-S cluster protein